MTDENENTCVHMCIKLILELVILSINYVSYVISILEQGLADHKDTLGAPLCPCR